MHRWLLIACLTAFLFSCSSEEKKVALADSSQISSLTIESLEGKKISVVELLKHNRASVFYFLMPGCPMCESYTLTINELEKKFREVFGLTVHIFRKSGFVWLQSTVTDGWSLREQNKQGESLNTSCNWDE